MFKNATQVKETLLSMFPRRNVLVIGDLMLDKYIWGSCNRISPEAPVPVVRLQRRTHVLGGAANVANNLASLAVRVRLAGLVGFDSDAALLVDECNRHGIDASLIQSVDEFCTIAKTRVLADDRQLVRFDEEISTPRPKDETDALLTKITQAIQKDRPDAVIISDYAKGLCTADFCRQLISMCREQGISVFVDPKGKDYLKYTGATCIKPNRSEMAEAAESLSIQSRSVVEAAAKMREILSLDFVALTLGAQGIAVLQEGHTTTMPTVAKEIYDVTGAGDTVLATLVAGFVSGLDILDSVALSNLAAAEVVARVGSTAVTREDLIVSVQAQSKSTGVHKSYSQSEMEVLVNAWKARGLKVGMTNGCFDVLHVGHVKLLEAASNQVDRLIVAVNSDASTTRLKGEGRPLMHETQRITLLSAFESVDAVVVYDDDTPIPILDLLKPDILFKGSDYSKDAVVGGDLVESYGGKVVLIPLVGDLGVSKLENVIGSL